MPTDPPDGATATDKRTHGGSGEDGGAGHSAFPSVLAALPIGEVIAAVERSTASDVDRALARSRSGETLGTSDVVALLSEAAGTRLEAMAQRAREVSIQRHGRAITLFAPLYLSNFCVNHCIYCGFKAGIKRIKRHTLTPQQIDREAAQLREMGFRHLLLVSGEHHDEVPADYMVEALVRCRRHFDSVSIEFEALDEDLYKRLVAAGCDGMALYQETYDPKTFKWAHPGRGPKTDYTRRLVTPDKAARAGMRSLGIGALLGLGDWRFEAVALLLHARYLMKHHWRSRVSVSFPRLRDETGGFTPKRPIGDREFVRVWCALRIALPDAEFVLSTRESPFLREHLTPLGANRLSAGSKTTPGGYADPTDAGAQFSIVDERSPEAVAAMIERLGYEPVWKDWDHGFHGESALVGSPAREATADVALPEGRAIGY